MSWAGTALFYSQLGSMLRAGLATPKALELAGTAAGGRYRTKSLAWAESCRSGNSLADTLVGEPTLAVALIRAGETSGRLPEMCKRIEELWQERIRLRSLVVGKLIYPGFLLHAALVVPQFPGVVLGTAEPSALIIGPVILWASIGAAWLLFHLANTGSLLARFMLLWPLSGLSLPIITANACQVLAAGLGSGMLARRALELTADACGNQIMGNRLRNAALGVETNRLSGITPALAEAGVMPLVIELAAAGEASGQLEATLNRAAVMASEAFSFRATWTARVFTGTIYVLIVMMTAATIIGMYAKVMGGAMQAADL